MMDATGLIGFQDTWQAMVDVIEEFIFSIYADLHPRILRCRAAAVVLNSLLTNNYCLRRT